MSDDTMNPAHEPNYKIMELQAENERLKDELITTLKEQVASLSAKVVYLEGLVTAKYNEEERDAGSHMIAPPLKVDLKPRVRTLSEVALLLEKRSRNIAEAKISAEDLKDESKVS